MLGREKQTPHISCKQPLGWACFLLQMDKYCILKMVEKALLSTFLSQLLLQSCQALGVQIQLPSIPYRSKQKLQVCSCIVFINSSLWKFLWRHLVSHASTWIGILKKPIIIFWFLFHCCSLVEVFRCLLFLADLLYKANLNTGSVLEYSLAFTSAALDKYCGKWSAVPKTGFIDITTSKDFYRIYSGLQIVRNNLVQYVSLGSFNW